jgi:flagellar hook assembly protein FlgD
VPVSLQIFNINGALVRTLIDDDLAAGLHERQWNGRDSIGRPVASGIYFYRLRLGTEVLNGRLEMVK